MLRFLRIAALIAIIGFVLYWPIQFLLSQTQVAEAQEQESVLPLPEELSDPESNLAPNIHTPEGYIQPAYDPFYNKYRPDETFVERIPVAERGTNTPPQAEFTIRQEQVGLPDLTSGTTKTSFVFIAAPRDHETALSRMQVRWDFEGDGTPDTFFSRVKRAEHVYSQPGDYEVALEVLDGGGLVNRIAKRVRVVTNTPPTAHFSYKPGTGTESRIFIFETDESEDSQYRSTYLQYRFDWDGDGAWDTPYERKTVWRHRFGVSGSQRVVMEAVDSEGLTDQAEALVEVTRNTPPTAAFTMEVKELKTTGGGLGTDASNSTGAAPGTAVRKQYIFNASGSDDTETPSSTERVQATSGGMARLQYRWDFNYTGPDDINFDTNFTTSPRHSGFFQIPGERMVRLEVRDEDGATDQAFLNIVVD